MRWKIYIRHHQKKDTLPVNQIFADGNAFKEIFYRDGETLLIHNQKLNSVLIPTQPRSKVV